MQVTEMSLPETVRVFFRKEGCAAYCSHLDLIRTMTRAMVRARIPAWYTQGFNPHLYMTFSLPLSLGVIGYCESLDFRLIEGMSYEEIATRLNIALPEGLRVLWVAAPANKPKDIEWADYRIELLCSEAQLSDAIKLLDEQVEIPVEKKSKKGNITIDMKPLFRVLTTSEGPHGICLELRCRAGIETNLNPMLVINQLCQIGQMPAGQTGISRTAIRTEELKEYR